MSSPRSDGEVRRTAAVHWFNHHRAGDMTADDERLFAHWLSQTPENRDAYEAVERDWALLGAVADDPEILAAREHDRRAFDAPARMRRLALAAATVLIAVTSVWAAIDSGVVDRFKTADAVEMATYRTSLGQRMTFFLSDGSEVTLDTDSEVTTGDMSETRMIELVRGRAFFRVAKDPSRPFIVRAGDKTVRATGTAFEVAKEEGGDITVTLVEGSVRVEEDAGFPRSGHGVDMSPGGQLSADSDSGWVVEPVDVLKETSWLNGQLVFFGDPLADAVAEMNRYSKQKIVFLEGRAPERKIVGVFRAGDVDGFVRAIELDGAAHVVSRDEAQIELATP